MAQFGYTLSSEEHAPNDLVTHAARAEEVGFAFCSISDHYHPWVEAQGHSPFVWGVLGAVAHATSTIDVAVGVTCPTFRIHPAVVAQAAATASLLLDGRFTFGVGSGENLNEHILGHRWPNPEVRLAMLHEAVHVMRRLWSGETVDHHDDFYTVENARLFDPPSQPFPLVVSGFGKAAAELAGQIGDGYWGHGTDRSMIETYESAGGSGPRYAQAHVCVGPDVELCRKRVHEIWPNAAIPGSLAQELPTWTHFEQAAQLVSPDDAVSSVVIGNDVAGVVQQVKERLDAGFDHVYLHQIGPDQQALFDLWSSDLNDALAELD
jgi:coenzyme F420-dependent glucose-6-phosphate dehydrogenase